MTPAEKKREYNKKYKLKNKEKIKLGRKLYHEKNKDRDNKQAKDFYYKNKSKFKGYEKKYKYGITQEEYEVLVLKQNNLCAICSNPPVSFKPVLYVDHDHNTGKVRGLLCHFCNAGIGMLKDDPNLLKKAIKYLEDKVK